MALPWIENGCNKNITERDVCIYGGGVFGSYAASRLRQLGKSVIVIDTNDHLGLAAHVYHCALNGKDTDCKAQLLHHTTAGMNLHARYSAPLKSSNIPAGMPTLFADFQRGDPLQLPVYSPKDIAAASATYAELRAQYPYLDETYDLPKDVPKDLLLSVDEFISKYDLQPLASIFNALLQGWPQFGDLPTLYLFKCISGDALTAIPSNILLPMVNCDIGGTFRCVQFSFDKKDLLLSSTIVLADRSSGIVIWAQTPTGMQKIHTKKLLVTVPPVMENLGGFDLDENEIETFSAFRPMNNWSGLLRHSSIPEGTRIINCGTNTPFHEMQLPGSQGFIPTADLEEYSWVYTSYKPTTQFDAEQYVLDELTRLKAGGIIKGDSMGQPDVVAISHCRNYALTVPAESIKGGFYRKLNALQGQKNTCFAGAAFSSQRFVNVLDHVEKHVLPLLVDNISLDIKDALTTRSTTRCALGNSIYTWHD